MRYFYIILLGLMLTAGCATNYRLETIREAREYALEQHPDLSDKSVHCIKFTTPRLQSNRLYARDGNAASKQDIVQTVVVWDLPDHDGKSLMVVGYGERNLFNWSPNRTIFKRFRKMGGEKKKKPTKTKPKKPTVSAEPKIKTEAEK